MVLEEKLIESKIIVENGKIKTIYSDDIENRGGLLTVEEGRRLFHQKINKVREMLQQK